MSNKLSVINSEEEWYSEGLSFECTGCGQCCTGAPGYVWVTPEEIESIAHHLSLSVSEFSKKYIRRVGKRFSLTEHPKTFDCDFLVGKRCSIYEVRPVQCRTFPWWPHIMKSPEAWRNTATYCEGINPQAKKVSKEKIDEQLDLYNTTLF